MTNFDCQTCLDCGILDREGTECPDCLGGTLKKCPECGEQHDKDAMVEHRTVDKAGDRTRTLCRFCALGCVDCGDVEGSVQRADEWQGWLVCETCDQNRHAHC